MNTFKVAIVPEGSPVSSKRTYTVVAEGFNTTNGILTFYSTVPSIFGHPQERAVAEFSVRDSDYTVVSSSVTEAVDRITTLVPANGVKAQQEEPYAGGEDVGGDPAAEEVYDDAYDDAQDDRETDYFESAEGTGEERAYRGGEDQEESTVATPVPTKLDAVLTLFERYITNKIVRQEGRTVRFSGREF